MTNTISNLPLKKQLTILIQKIKNILKKEYAINKKYQHALDEFHAMLKVGVKESYKRQNNE